MLEAGVGWVDVVAAHAAAAAAAALIQHVRLVWPIPSHPPTSPSAAVEEVDGHMREDE